MGVMAGATSYQHQQRDMKLVRELERAARPEPVEGGELKAVDTPSVEVLTLPPPRQQETA